MSEKHLRRRLSARPSNTYRFKLGFISFGGPAGAAVGLAYKLIFKGA